ncbi:hypothetical protein, partial [Vibrio parahaemolyticus]|uniref:hypothetical protein n=1 Tax=Vibrio parahaemolyticus TaxID=670 RepID=UPI001C608CA5
TKRSIYLCLIISFFIAASKWLSQCLENQKTISRITIAHRDIFMDEIQLNHLNGITHHHLNPRGLVKTALASR